MNESKPEDDSIGAAILGFFAAIRICEKGGYDPEKVFQMMLDFVNRQELPELGGE